MRAAIVSHTYVEPENRGKLAALAAAGVTLSVFVPSRWEEVALEKAWTVTSEHSFNLDVVPVPVQRVLGSPAAALWDLSLLRERLDRSEIDVVHVEEEPWSLAARSALQAARKRRVPSVIFTWQNLPGHPPWPFSLLARRTLALADGWIAGNETGARLLARIDSDRPRIVLPQLGIDMPEAADKRAAPGEPLHVGFVGRLVPEKGVADLLEAFGSMTAPSTLAVVGDGPARASLERSAQQLGVASRVAFHGSMSHVDVAALWPSLDVLVLPSRTTPKWAEQFGHVLVEAMAHGVAVVGSSSGAIPEVVGDAGVIVPERDPRAIAEALDRLARDPAQLEQLGRRGRDRAEHRFTNRALAAQTVAFWTALVTGK